jgi:hypothetical protein
MESTSLFLCETCGRWSMSHTTGEHQGSNSNSPDNSQKPQTIANSGLTLLDPSTWYVNLSLGGFLGFCPFGHCTTPPIRIIIGIFIGILITAFFAYGTSIWGPFSWIASCIRGGSLLEFSYAHSCLGTNAQLHTNYWRHVDFRLDALSFLLVSPLGHRSRNVFHSSIQVDARNSSQPPKRLRGGSYLKPFFFLVQLLVGTAWEVSRSRSFCSNSMHRGLLLNSCWASAVFCSAFFSTIFSVF